MGYELKFMERAIKLAKLGIGRVDPNPLVGAVIVKDGKIIGEGYHTGYGMPHAEREAINNLTEPAQGAEMYITLEPCAHQGKQPPCTAAIIDAGIRTVYIGSSDPNPKVNGKGIWMLRHHGIEVVTGVMKKECDALNPVFFHYITTGQPYIVLKYAMTLDGKTATVSGESRYISGDFSRGRVRALRNQYPAIMVGIGTVLADDPMLDTRRQKDRVPTRIICDTHLDIPMESKIVKSAGQIKTYIAAGEESAAKKQDKIRELEVEGAEVILVPEKLGQLDLISLILKLGSMGISGIMIEGGGRLAWSFIREGLVNEIVTFTAPKVFGGAGAITPVEGDGVDRIEDAIPFHLVDSEVLPGGDIYARYIVGPEPEEEEEGIEILAAEPHPIRKIQSQEFKLLEVNGENGEEEAEGDQVSVQEDTNPEPAPEKKVNPELAFEETEKLTQEAFDAITAAAQQKKKMSGENITSWADGASDNWAEADDIPVKKASPRIPGQGDDFDDLDADDAPKVELESRIVTEVLSADLNPFNITEEEEKKN